MARLLGQAVLESKRRGWEERGFILLYYVELSGQQPGKSWEEFYFAPLARRRGKKFREICPGYFLSLKTFPVCQKQG